MVTGATFNKMDESVCDPVLLNIIKRHLIRSNGNDDEYGQLDKYLFAYYLSCTADDLLTKVSWTSFVLRDAHVFTVEHLPDIGRNIRQIILGDVHTETFTRLIFFSLPYLKHNRLTLPPIHETKFADLQSCLRILHASILGLLQRNSKKPPWKMRVQMHVFTSQLLLNATHQDMYIFFKSHLAVLRLSLIEYVIYFIRKNMDMEQRVFEKIFSLHNRSALQFGEMLCLINTFRIQAYDDGVLDMSRLNEKAMLTLERCNRMCACKVNPMSIFNASVSRDAKCYEQTSSAVQTAFDMPKICSRLFMHALHPSKSFLDVSCMSKIQASVSLHPLPYALYLKQVRALRVIFDRHALKAVYATRCSICVLCGLKQQMLDDKMRIQHDARTFCSSCNSCQHVITVDTLGVLLNVRGMTMFWCPCCSIVHRWLASGHDFEHCSYTRIFCPPTVKTCLVCNKRNGLQDVEVLQADAGFVSTITLCYKHRPWDYQLKLVTDVDSLVHALQTKRNTRPSY